MPLNDIAIRAAKPGPKPIKLSDEKGLFLLVTPTGGKLWPMKYRIAGKEKKLALGRYPDVALKEARERCAEARKLIASGIDPSEKKRVERLDAALKAETTFKAVAEEYIEKSDREGRAAVTIGKARWLLSLLAPSLLKALKTLKDRRQDGPFSVPAAIFCCDLVHMSSHAARDPRPSGSRHLCCNCAI